MSGELTSSLQYNIVGRSHSGSCHQLHFRLEARIGCMIIWKWCAFTFKDTEAGPSLFPIKPVLWILFEKILSLSDCACHQEESGKKTRATRGENLGEWARRYPNTEIQIEKHQGEIRKERLPGEYRSLTIALEEHFAATTPHNMLLNPPTRTFSQRILKTLVSSQYIRSSACILVSIYIFVLLHGCSPFLFI